MEVCKEATLRFLYEILYSCLQAEPFELARDQLVAGHDRINMLFPVGSHQGTAARLL